MSAEQWRNRKVTIVGAGAVGSTFAYALAHSGLADEIALLDRNPEVAEGQVLDLAHGTPFFPPVEIHTGDKSDYADAQVIVITAGTSQRPGESRLDLLQRNVSIMESIVDDIAAQDSESVIVVVSNPVDVLTYAVQKRIGGRRGRVIGSGTVLDSARFRYLLGQHCGIDVHNVHAYILGEHGDSEFASWSMTHLAGIRFDDYCPLCGLCDDWEKERSKIVDTVRKSAYHIIDYKGATNFAVGLALVRIVGAILRDQRSMLTVSAVLDGEYGLHDVCLSVPCVVSQQGVIRIIEAEFPPDEHEALYRSASVIREAIAALKGSD